MKRYDIRFSIKKHSSDVRSACVLDVNQFVTSSRDSTSMIWDFNEDSVQVTKTLIGHAHYISSCCAIKPCQQYQRGLIITGSNDSKICVYDPDNIHPLFFLSGHTNTVCSLTPLSENTFASGSWDGNVIIWEISSQKQISCIKGNGGSVFAILLFSTKEWLITASADKNINIYKWPELDLVKILSGHNDCVRGLKELDNDEIVSCSNDGSIRLWNVRTGLFIKTLFTTSSYLYSIDAEKDGSIIVCGGENNTVVMVNRFGVKHQIHKMPALAVWDVLILPNSDILTCCSDGYIRIFRRVVKVPFCSNSVDNVRNGNGEDITEPVQASEEECLKLSDLPGPEALIKPAVKDGQILLVREDDKAVCYQWSQSACTWVLIGDVTNVDQPNPPTVPKTNKVLYEGKEYDYVFDVDVKDGEPPLKLPYSRGKDPYQAAMEFLNLNNLPLGYVNEIVDFIQKNTNNEPVVIQESTNFNQPLNQDSELLFPTDIFVEFSFVDLPKIKAKIIEFGLDICDECDETNVSEVVDKLEALCQICINDEPPSDETLDVLRQCLEWPPGKIFPVLDLLRLAMTRSTINEILCEKLEMDLLKAIKCYTQISALPVNNMLTLKVLTNMMLHSKGQEFVMRHLKTLFKAVKYLPSRRERSISFELAISSFLLNVVVLLIKINDKTRLVDALEVAFSCMGSIRQKDATFRLLVTIGTACSSLEKINLHQTFRNHLECLSNCKDQDELSTKNQYSASKILQTFQHKFYTTN